MFRRSSVRSAAGSPPSEKYASGSMPTYGSSNSFVFGASVLVIFRFALPWNSVQCGLNWLPEERGVRAGALHLAGALAAERERAARCCRAPASVCSRGSSAVPGTRPRADERPVPRVVRVQLHRHVDVGNRGGGVGDAVDRVLVRHRPHDGDVVHHAAACAAAARRRRSPAAWSGSPSTRRGSRPVRPASCPRVRAGSASRRGTAGCTTSPGRSACPSWRAPAVSIWRAGMPGASARVRPRQ